MVPYKRNFSQRALSWFPPLLLTLVPLDPSLARGWSGKVVGVIDGDSMTVLHEGRGEQTRLWGIDCPEKSQDFGIKAKQITSILVFAKTVEVDPIATDRYRRTVAFVRVGDILVNDKLIRQGLAWVFGPLLRPGYLRAVGALGGRGTKREARLAVNVECNPPVGV